MTLDAEVAHLRAENAELRLQTAQLQEQLAAALARIAELEQQPPDPPPFVKPNRLPSTEPKRKRKKRAAHHNHGRRCEPPTRTEPHALDRCPDCNRQLTGGSIDYRRQVIELPQPLPVDVIEHQVVKRWCAHCRRWRSPQLDLTGQVFGQGRIGTRIASLVAFLALVLRLPMRRIQAYLRLVHQLTISTGEVVELLLRYGGHYKARSTRSKPKHEPARSCMPTRPPGARMVRMATFGPSRRRESKRYATMNTTTAVGKRW